MDHEKLRDVLGKWRDIERVYETGGLSFFEALRLVAGAPAGASEAAPIEGSVAGWSRVSPGPWLAEVLAGLRGPTGWPMLRRDGTSRPSCARISRSG